MSKYTLVVADNPWSFGDKLTMSATRRGAAMNYNTLSTDELCSLPVKDIINPNGAVLALWVPSSLLSDGLRVMEAWGFQQKQVFVWVKTKKEPLGEDMKDIVKFFTKLGSWDWTINGSVVKKFVDNFTLNNVMSMGLGRLFRQAHEICLIGTSNNKIYKQLQDRSQRSVCFAPNLKHSQKPEALQDSLDIMFPPPADGTINRIEIFGRRSRKNWLVVGNEAPETQSLDIRVVLDNILNDCPPNTPPQ